MDPRGSRAPLAQALRQVLLRTSSWQLLALALLLANDFVPSARFSVNSAPFSMASEYASAKLATARRGADPAMKLTAARIIGIEANEQSVATHPAARSTRAGMVPKAIAATPTISATVLMTPATLAMICHVCAFQENGFHQLRPVGSAALSGLFPA